jgi:hypothetical protein
MFTWPQNTLAAQTKHLVMASTRCERSLVKKTCARGLKRSEMVSEASTNPPFLTPRLMVHPCQNEPRCLTSKRTASRTRLSRSADHCGRSRRPRRPHADQRHFSIMWQILQTGPDACRSCGAQSRCLLGCSRCLDCIEKAYNASLSPGAGEDQTTRPWTTSALPTQLALPSSPSDGARCLPEAGELTHRSLAPQTPTADSTPLKTSVQKLTVSGADPPPEAKAPGRGGDNEGDVIAAVRGPAARGEALLAVTAEAPAAEETTKVTSSLLSADSVGRHAEATPPLEARRGRRDNRSPSVTAAADETCASSGWDDASRASPELAAAAPPPAAHSPAAPPCLQTEETAGRSRVAV